jgi:DNA-binding SARP family transcriptional activator
VAAPAITILGGFELRVGGAPVPLQPSAQRLVAFLALHGRPVQRAYVAGSLWLDASEGRATASLRTTLWRAATAAAGQLVEATATHLALGESVEVDLREATSLAHSVIDGRHARPPREAAERLLRADDDVLPDWYDDWVVIERERYRQLRLHALEALCVELAGAGAYADAVDAGIAAVAVEPLRESAHRALMEAHLAEGNAVEAIREYRAFSQLLHAELGLRPTPRIRTLAERALGRGDGAVTPA